MVWARTRRQLQADLPARVAHHHIAEQLPQQRAVFGQARVTARHELLAKLLGAFELSRLKYGDQVVELAEPVLYRGGGEE